MIGLNDLSVSVRDMTETASTLQEQIVELRNKPPEVKIVEAPVEFAQYLNCARQRSNGGIIHKELLDNGMMSLKYNDLGYKLVVSSELLTLVYIAMPEKFVASDVMNVLSKLDNLTFKPNLRNSATIMRFFLSSFSEHCYTKTKGKDKLIVIKNK